MAQCGLLTKNAEQHIMAAYMVFFQPGCIKGFFSGVFVRKSGMLADTIPPPPEKLIFAGF
jgi:hypothetical protein